MRGAKDVAENLKFPKTMRVIPDPLGMDLGGCDCNRGFKASGVQLKLKGIRKNYKKDPGILMDSFGIHSHASEWF